MKEHLSFLWDNGDFETLTKHMNSNEFETGIIIVGESGVGKTRLMMSLVDMKLRNNKGTRAIFLLGRGEGNNPHNTYESDSNKLIQTLRQPIDLVAYDDCESPDDFANILDMRLAGHDVIATSNPSKWLAEDVYDNIMSSLNSCTKNTSSIKDKLNAILLIEKVSDGNRKVTVLREGK